MWKKIDQSNYEISDSGQIKNSVNNKLLKTFLNERGYECIALPLEEKGKKQRCKIHRLVAKFFLEDYSEDLEVHHINGIRHDNRAENLSCVTRLENIRAISNKKRVIPYVNGKQAIEEIINLHKLGKSVDEIFITLRSNQIN